MTVVTRRHGSIQRRVAHTSKLSKLVSGHRFHISQSFLSISEVWISEREEKWGKVQANTVHIFSTSSDLPSSLRRQKVFTFHR